MKKKIKLIVEIPEKYYEACKDAVEESYPSQIEEIIAHGIPYNPTGDAISREALKDIAYINKGNFNTVEGIREWIDNAQAVNTDVVADNVITAHENIGYEKGFNDGYAKCVEDNGRPKGEWINHRNDYGHNIADCSLCGKTMQWHDEDGDGIPRYCWYCGADMQKGDAE